MVTPTAVAGVADMSETERGRESLGAGTPSQNTQRPQVEVGDSHKINVESVLWTLPDQDVLELEVVLYTSL